MLAKDVSVFFLKSTLLDCYLHIPIILLRMSSFRIIHESNVFLLEFLTIFLIFCVFFQFDDNYMI